MFPLGSIGYIPGRIASGVGSLEMPSVENTKIIIVTARLEPNISDRRSNTSKINRVIAFTNVMTLLHIQVCTEVYEKKDP